MSKIPKTHIEFLVRHLQENSGVLHVDGVYGPKTSHYIQGILNPIAAVQQGDLLQRAWVLALQDVGKGGQGGNNAGPYIRGLRQRCGFPDHLTGAWCAVFVSAMMRDAGGPRELRSRGAYRLVEKLSNHENGFEIEPEHMEIGKVYLAVWKRDRWRTHREAHIRFIKKVDHDSYQMIGGNERPDTVNFRKETDLENIKDDLIMIAGYEE